MISRQTDLSDIQGKLIKWLQKKMPDASDLSITNMERSGSGFSNESFLFNLDWAEAGQSMHQGMLLRCAPKTYPVYPDYDLSKQFRIMENLKGARFPVPSVYWLEEDEKLLGAPFYIMGRIDGEVPPDYPPYHSSGICRDASPEQRARMWWSCVEALAEIHKVDWQGLGFSFMGMPGNDNGPLGRELEYWERYLNWAKEEPQPVLEASLDWLKENQYTPERVSLCWGDARMPNTIWRTDGELLGILDWEMAYLGDPESDFVFFITLDWFLSEGTGIPRLHGFPGREDTIQRYEELTGWKVNNYLYNEVSAALRSGIVILKVQKNLEKIGIAPPGEGTQANNFCTQKLAALLNLPSPGPGPEEKIQSNIEDIVVTVQFHFTGEGGRDWHLISDRGSAMRYEGRAESPDVTVIVSAEDWAAIRSGELKRFHAYTSGRLKIDGDRTVFNLLEDTIERFEL